MQINCTVFDCEHCNCDESCCKLKEIKVCKCECGCESENTMCASYKER